VTPYLMAFGSSMFILFEGKNVAIFAHLTP
jgi:hypothetical protein